MENEETPKVTKTEEKESFLKGLDTRLAEIKKATEEYGKLVERNEELAARSLLGGRSDAGIQPVEKKEETPAEYAKRISLNQLTPEELKKA